MNTQSIRFLTEKETFDESSKFIEIFSADEAITKIAAFTTVHVYKMAIITTPWWNHQLMHYSSGKLEKFLKFFLLFFLVLKEKEEAHDELT